MRCWIATLLGLLAAATGSGAVTRPSTVPSTLPLRMGDAILELPDHPDDLVAGGSGRYLLALSRRLGKVIVIDVRQRKVVKYVDVAGEGAAMAGGAKKFFLLTGAKLERWSFESLQREMSVAAPPQASRLDMGASSDGPLLVDGRSLIDPTTLKPMALSSAAMSASASRPAATMAFADPNPLGRGATATAISHDGSTVLTNGGIPAVVRLDAPRPRSRQLWLEQDSKPSLLSADGELLVGSYEILSRLGQRLVEKEPQLWPRHLPTYSPSLLLRVVTVDGENRRGQDCQLINAADFSPIVSLPDMPELDEPRTDRPEPDRDLPLAKRLHVLLDDGVIATLRHNPEAIVLRSFDVNEELRSGPAGYLVVTSAPPRTLRVGATLNYRMDVRSEAGKPTCKLTSGPAGMTVTPEGVVQWTVPALAAGTDEKPAEASAAILVRDSSGREITHRIAFIIEKRSGQ